MKSDCEKLKERIPDFLAGTMSEAERRTYEEEIKSCPEVAEELASFLKLESELNLVVEKEVPFSVDAKFLRMLEEEQSASKNEVPMGKSTLNYWYIAASIALLILGFVGGRMSSTSPNSDQEIIGLQNDIKDMKQMVMLSMIENQSASERIRAVSYTEEMIEPDQKIISSLIKTLKTDESPNVRLASAEALKRFANSPLVRAELVKAMESQTDPILQIALINILVEIEEKSAIKQLRKWSESAEINEVVRKQADIGIQILI